MSGRRGELLWQRLGLLLLVFFFLGYLGVAFFGHPDYLTAGILFWGSIFVSCALLLMYHLVDSLKDRSLQITQTLISVIDARDSNLNGHSRNVQNLCMCLYRHLPSEMRDSINAVNFEYAALLHDVGKLGVPEKILNKEGKLDDEEWKIMRDHPRIAMDLLKPLPSFEDIKEWILYHHERIDGKGYYSVPGDRIPLAARLIAVCDTYSAITMKRSYKPARTHEEACGIIREVAGSQLDPNIAAVFLSIPKEELVACAPETVELSGRISQNKAQTGI
ncbi:MAG: HD domain-containing protein [Lachnospiraceae bacterium]|nr:HD domain-containing protein [Lachnospiraceae bacterium]